MPKARLFHWKNGKAADCGAPPGSRVTEYPHVVTCPQCIVALKLELLRRRLAAHRASVALGGLRRSKRGGEALTFSTTAQRTKGRGS